MGGFLNLVLNKANQKIVTKLLSRYDKKLALVNELQKCSTAGSIFDTYRYVSKYDDIEHVLRLSTKKTKPELLEKMNEILSPELDAIFDACVTGNKNALNELSSKKFINYKIYLARRQVKGKSLSKFQTKMGNSEKLYNEIASLRRLIICNVVALLSKKNDIKKAKEDGGYKAMGKELLKTAIIGTGFKYVIGGAKKTTKNTMKTLAAVSTNKNTGVALLEGSELLGGLLVFLMVPIKKFVDGNLFNSAG